MPRSAEQLEQAAADAEVWLDSLDPASLQTEDPVDLRRIGLAVIAQARLQDESTAAVAAARANGRSWAEIATVLGVSRQSAQERYGEPAVR